MEIMTLAQRKAAKKATLLNQEQVASNQNPIVNTMPNITVEEAILAHSKNLETLPASTISNGVGAIAAKANSMPALSAQEILELAAKHGLKLQSPKKEFVKHTYSVTTDSKALFKKYCDVLGINMQDAMEEALQDFFKKHALEYSRIKEAKNA